MYEIIAMTYIYMSYICHIYIHIIRRSKDSQHIIIISYYYYFFLIR